MTQLQLVPFNGPVEMGLRCLAILSEAFPSPYSLQKLIFFDYLTVHSDDAPDGPQGLHPKTPYRGGELLVRRNSIQQGLLLYQSRGLLKCNYYAEEGLFYIATESAGSFLDTLEADYVNQLRMRSHWVVQSYGGFSDDALTSFVKDNIEDWGAEFEWSSVLWTEEAN